MNIERNSLIIICINPQVRAAPSLVGGRGRRGRRPGQAVVDEPHGAPMSPEDPVVLPELHGALVNDISDDDDPGVNASEFPNK